ncbi:hypothetical protein SCNU_03022 [Gordonia neofelifaecis NRRL B-59395]|uniref:Uncharacterized protein n=1 Tax=Gordonia neofelifaecis NRRL B-59395 TaxID=644548 RepID=F1YFR2_9ACTN|nr:hypothetical protein SCNU_03022 [Gordonia neofelifaecis NRRL B-59395]
MDDGGVSINTVGFGVSDVTGGVVDSEGFGNDGSDGISRLGSCFRISSISPRS